MGLDKIRQLLDGKKTYITQAVAVIVAITSYLLGPIDIGTIHIPQLQFKELIEVLQIGGGFIFIRLGLTKLGEQTK